MGLNLLSGDKMGIKQFFNNAVTLGLAFTRQLNVSEREDLRQTADGLKYYDNNAAHTSFFERAQKARDAGDRTRLGEFFNNAVEAGKILLGQRKSMEGMRAKNGGLPGEFERNPTDEGAYKSRLERAREALKNPKPGK
jgi:hypothetical protein